MGVIFPVPILFIVALILGVFGVDISFVIGIIRWGCILIGAFGIFINVCGFLEDRSAAWIIMLVLSIGIIVLGISFSNYLDSLVKFGELSIFDILMDIF